MSNFVSYFDPEVRLSDRLSCIFETLSISKEQKEIIDTFMRLLEIKDLPSYEHCARVGILTYLIAAFMHLDKKAGLYSGLLHDAGKAQTHPSTLKKTEGWTPADTKEVRRHVMDTYRLLRNQFDFTAEIVLWHHRFQANGYPTKLPPLLHDYSQGTKIMIPLYGRLLSLADCFDALHRVNDKFGKKDALTGEAIQEKMFALNPDQQVLITELYAADIFTTRIYQ